MIIQINELHGIGIYDKFNNGDHNQMQDKCYCLTLWPCNFFGIRHQLGNSFDMGQWINAPKNGL